MFDLDAYLTRIGHHGDRSPTLDTLREVHAKHVQVITFENLNPLAGWPVLLDVDSVQRKLVQGGRGGYCFEQNLLLSEALRALGFSVTELAARVLWSAPEDSMPPRTHMLLQVQVDGAPYIADVGFGGQTLTGPLRLEPDIEQTTPHEPFRLIRAGNDFKLQSKVGKNWKSLYRFDLQPQFPSDYAVANHYLCTHPESPFRTSLRVARTAPGKRFGLANNYLSIHHLDGPSEKRVLKSVAEVRQTLEEVFGLTLPPGPELDAALERVCRFRA
ncbi:MAG: arylamine N-acetyltransferase [Steroidobacteraceae bacterium]|nr:arylamine N-acetyltransferase [Steroidobacteraceae bacterium]